MAEQWQVAIDVSQDAAAHCNGDDRSMLPALAMTLQVAGQAPRVRSELQESKTLSSRERDSTPTALGLPGSQRAATALESADSPAAQLSSLDNVHQLNKTNNTADAHLSSQVRKPEVGKTQKCCKLSYILPRLLVIGICLVSFVLIAIYPDRVSDLIENFCDWMEEN